MASNQQMVEETGAWCIRSSELAAERDRARRQFFAEDDPRPVKHWPGADAGVSLERRFLGYLMFDSPLQSARA